MFCVNTNLSMTHFRRCCYCDSLIIFGPMFSGKTTELIRRLKRYEVANHKCLIIKYAKDLRYESKCGEGVATHDHQSRAAVAATALSSITHLANNCSVIGIDEGQFFPDVVEFSEAMANAGKIVVVAALDGTYQRSGFGNFLNLVPLAENVVKLTAVCMHCYGEAAFTQRLGSETEVELIGGSEKYMAVCRECYRKFSEANNESLAEDCCHGNRVSSPFHQLHQRPNNKSPLKVNNSPTKHLTVQVNRILFLDKENL
ncbi:Thymidine kinase [Daphnia magna]|uniref:Thymidine kinase n=1 Tax=Daphnia magna TaxID=35525 RepID=A0A162CEF1_9CRUS|nr:Thymidine kinase [Daphnia magna]